jgi:phospholipase C
VIRRRVLRLVLRNAAVEFGFSRLPPQNPPRRIGAPLKDHINRRAALRLGLSAATGLWLPACGLGPSLCGGRAPNAVPDVPTAAYDLLRGIDTVVVVMLENRSFDHLFGGLALDRDYPGRQRVDGLTGEESNLDGAGAPVAVHRLDGTGAGTLNPKHDWDSMRATFNDGRNDGFVRTNAGANQREVMSFLGRDQIPFLYALADRFTVCDRWFSSAMGPTWPNRYHLHATTSRGLKKNLPMLLDTPMTIWDGLAARCLRGKNYGAGPLLWYTMAFPLRAISGNDAMVPAPMESFFEDALSGQLPELAVLDPEFRVADGSPRHDLALAEGFLAAVYRAMTESPQWARSLLVITFDEHGGYYDHVVPPLTSDPRPEFRQLGFRVPTLVVGPTVWQGGVVSTPFEHVSVAATLRARFGVASLGPRMAAAEDLSACIDPALLGSSAPPPRDLPQVEIEGGRLAASMALPADEDTVRALDAGGAPLDGRSVEQRRSGWLRWAQDLEAVKVTA